MFQSIICIRLEGMKRTTKTCMYPGLNTNWTRYRCDNLPDVAGILRGTEENHD
jgi:hypothetical protein